MTGKILKHVVFVAGCGITHIRPALHILARLVAKFQNLFISFYVAQPLVSQAEGYFAAHHQAVWHRIRITTSSHSNQNDHVFKLHESATVTYSDNGSREQVALHECSQLQEMNSDAIELADMPFLKAVLGFEHEFGPWIAEQLSRGNTEINGSMIEAPSYIIEDIVNGGVALANKQYHNLPISGLWTSSAVSYISLVGRNQYGNASRLHDILVTMSNQEAKKYVQNVLVQELCKRLVLTPGLPRHYEHELVPQDMREPQPIHVQVLQVNKRWDYMMQHTDKVVFANLYEMESIAVEAYASAVPKQLMTFSAGLAADRPLPKARQVDIDTSDPVLLFMNRAYTELGSHSVIYIGFGSFWFPPLGSAPYLRVLIEEMVAYGFRVVLSCSLQHRGEAFLDEEFTKGLTEAGNVIFSEWVQQLKVLEHPALHYFVSHGGWNSVTEAIVRGVPMIIWPISADQPVNAMLMSRQHDCCFELLQVRTGAAKSVAYSDQGDIPITGSATVVRDEIKTVLALSKSERGVQQRRNIEALRKVAEKAMEAGGSGDLALEEFGHAIGLS